MLIFADMPPNELRTAVSSVQYASRYALFSAAALTVVDDIEMVRFDLARAAAGQVTSSAMPADVVKRAQVSAEREIGAELFELEPPLVFDAIVRMKVSAMEFSAPQSDFD